MAQLPPGVVFVTPSGTTNVPVGTVKTVQFTGGSASFITIVKPDGTTVYLNAADGTQNPYPLVVTKPGLNSWPYDIYDTDLGITTYQDTIKFYGIGFYPDGIPQGATYSASTCKDNDWGFQFTNNVTGQMRVELETTPGNWVQAGSSLFITNTGVQNKQVSFAGLAPGSYRTRLKFNSTAPVAFTQIDTLNSNVIILQPTTPDFFAGTAYVGQTTNLMNTTTEGMPYASAYEYTWYVGSLSNPVGTTLGAATPFSYVFNTPGSHQVLLTCKTVYASLSTDCISGPKTITVNVSMPPTTTWLMQDTTCNCGNNAVKTIWSVNGLENCFALQGKVGFNSSKLNFVGIEKIATTLFDTSDVYFSPYLLSADTASIGFASNSGSLNVNGNGDFGRLVFQRLPGFAVGDVEVVTATLRVMDSLNVSTYYSAQFLVSFPGEYQTEITTLSWNGEVVPSGGIYLTTTITNENGDQVVVDENGKALIEGTQFTLERELPPSSSAQYAMIVSAYDALQAEQAALLNQTLTPWQRLAAVQYNVAGPAQDSITVLTASRILADAAGDPTYRTGSIVVPQFYTTSTDWINAQNDPDYIPHPPSSFAGATTASCDTTQSITYLVKGGDLDGSFTTPLGVAGKTNETVTINWSTAEVDADCSMLSLIVQIPVGKKALTARFQTEGMTLTDVKVGGASRLSKSNIDGHIGIAAFVPPPAIQNGVRISELKLTFKLENLLAVKFLPEILILDNEQIEIVNVGVMPCVTGIKNNLDDVKFSLSPNPVINTMTLTFPQEYRQALKGQAVKIYDATGRIIGQQLLSGEKEIALDVSNLPTGLYTAQIDKFSSKFVKM